MPWMTGRVRSSDVLQPVSVWGTSQLICYLIFLHVRLISRIFVIYILAKMLRYKTIYFG